MQEIRRSPVEVGSLSHDLQGVVASQVVVWISEASTVSLEFQDRNSRNDFDSHLQAMEKKNVSIILPVSHQANGFMHSSTKSSTFINIHRIKKNALKIP